MVPLTMLASIKQLINPNFNLSEKWYLNKPLVTFRFIAVSLHVQGGSQRS